MHIWWVRLRTVLIYGVREFFVMFNMFLFLPRATPRGKNHKTVLRIYSTAVSCHEYGCVQSQAVSITILTCAGYHHFLAAGFILSFFFSNIFIPNFPAISSVVQNYRSSYQESVEQV